VALDAAHLVVAVQVALAVLDVIDLAVLGLLGQAEVAAPVVRVAEQLARAPLDVLDLLEHLDVVVGDRDALHLHDHPHVLIAGRERDGAALEVLVEFDRVRQLDGVLVRLLVDEHLAQVDAGVASLLRVAIHEVPDESLQHGVLLVDLNVEEG